MRITRKGVAKVFLLFSALCFSYIMIITSPIEQAEDDYYVEKRVWQDSIIYNASRIYNTAQELSLTAISYTINTINNLQTIYNLRIFHKQSDISANGKPGLHSSIYSMIVVVQVHDRVDYLQHLIKSLRTAAEIDQILLIFSHDYYSQEMNKLVSSVDFCPVSKRELFFFCYTNIFFLQSCYIYLHLICRFWLG